MKTFKQFLEEANTHAEIKMRLARLIAFHPNPEQAKIYRKMLDTYREKEKDNIDYPDREAARKDKNLIPSHRESSFPELAGVSTKTKNKNKLRKQRALGEIQ